MTILVVEDETWTATAIKQAARTAGADQVTVASSRQEAATALDSGSWDLVILDLVLPGGDGSSIAAACRVAGVPFLIVSSRTLPMDVALGLDMGAEDYVKKPVSEEELVARIRHILKRRVTGGIADAGVLNLGDLTINRESRIVEHGGSRIELTPTEEKLLFCLVDAAGAYCSTDRLVRSVWGDNPPADGPLTVRVHIRRLRRKLEPGGDPSHYIVNKWGAGYRLAFEMRG